MIATCYHCDFCEGGFSERVVPAAIEHQKDTGHTLVIEGDAAAAAAKRETERAKTK